QEKNAGSERRRQPILNFAVGAVLNGLSDASRKEKCKENTEKSESQAQVFVCRIPSDKPRKIDQPREQRRGVKDRCPVTQDRDREDPRVYHRHVNEQEEIIRGARTQKKRNGICTYQPDVRDHLTVIKQSRGYGEQRKQRHQAKGRALR